MKKLFKESKKSGLPGYMAKRKMRITFMALGGLAIIAILMICTGTFLGFTGAGLISYAIIAPFVVPDNLGLKEEEKKGIQALANHFTKQFEQVVKGKLSSEEALNKMDQKLQEWAEKNLMEHPEIEKMSEALKKQGQVLNELKEKESNGFGKIGGLKGAFEKNWESLQKALKEKRVGYEVKAIDEHNPALIHTTGNIVTTTTGANLFESIVNDPNLHLKRRDRQYIHDIANVSYVNELPEVYTFWEEGDETGAIAVVSENGLKPQIKLSLIKNQVEAQKAAGYIVVTEEVIKWRSRAWAAIQRLFRDKVYRDFENLLTNQLLTNASTYTSTALDGTIAAPTDFDAIIAAILQGESLNYQYDTLVINPADKWRLAMTTTANGMFVLPYIQNGGQFGLLGLRVITTNKVTAGTFLIGESGTWYIEEEAPTFRTGLVNDDHIHNRMTIVGEIFFLSYVPSNNAGSWISGNFADIKEALQSTAVQQAA